MRSHLFILSFMSLALWGCISKIFLHAISDIFLSMFFSGTFMVLYIIFKSFIHLQFIFVYGKFVVKFLFLFLFFPCSCPALPTPFFKGVIFTPFNPSAPPELNTNWHEFISWLYPLPLLYVSVLMPVPDCFDYWGLVIQFDIRYCDPSCFVLLSQNCCGYSGSFMVPYKFLKCLFYICQICHWF